jgi:hypothetical protein
MLVCVGDVLGENWQEVFSLWLSWRKKPGRETRASVLASEIYLLCEWLELLRRAMTREDQVWLPHILMTCAFWTCQSWKRLRPSCSALSFGRWGTQRGGNILSMPYSQWVQSWAHNSGLMVIMRFHFSNVLTMNKEFMSWLSIRQVCSLPL